MLLALPLFIVSCNTPEAGSDYANAGIEQACKVWHENRQQAGKSLFLDVRGADEYAQGHIPDAKLLPVQKERS